MKVLLKYYDAKLKLKTITGKNKIVNPKISFIRFKVLRGNKEWPCCDFKGNCTNKVYAEVYPNLMKGDKKGWSYLCRKHYYREQRKLKWKLPACLNFEW